MLTSAARARISWGAAHAEKGSLFAARERSHALLRCPNEHSHFVRGLHSPPQNVHSSSSPVLHQVLGVLSTAQGGGVWVKGDSRVKRELVASLSAACTAGGGALEATSPPQGAPPQVWPGHRRWYAGEPWQPPLPPPPGLWGSQCCTAKTCCPRYSTGPATPACRAVSWTR